MANKLGLFSRFDYQIFSGMGVFKGSKIEVTDISDTIRAVDRLAKEWYLDLLNEDYDWLIRYNFDLSFIKRLSKDEIQRIDSNG